MISREDAQNLAGTVESLRLELAACRLQVEECQQQAARLTEDNERLREEFRDLFEEAPIPYVHEGLDTRFIRANRAAMRLLGLRPDDVANTFGKSLVAETPETQRQLRQALGSIESGNERAEVELELRRKDNGAPVWVQWWSKPASTGTFTRTMMIDITDRVQMSQTKAALEFSLESGLVGDWDLNLITDTSRRSLRHDRCFGYSSPLAEAAWGAKTFIEHVHPDDRVRVETSFRSAVDPSSDWASEFRVVWPDGSVHWLAARGRIFEMREGKPSRMLGVVMEITDRKIAEEALRETKAALEFTLTSGRIGDWDLDLITDTSRRSLRHDQCFGYDSPIPEADWGIAVFIQHVHPDDRTRVEASLRGAVADSLDWAAEFRAIWPDGSVHWLDARGSIYRATDGRPTRMLGTVMDITDRKHGEEALRASEQVSRGQVDALKSTLDALATEPSHERLVGHILRIITTQFGAHSCSVWCRDRAGDMIGLAYAFEDGGLVPNTDARFAGLDRWLPMSEAWPWPEVFRAGKPSLIEDIRTVPAFPLRDRLLPMGIVTVLLIPMTITGRLEGAIGLRFVEQRAFRAQEMELAQALANQAMLMIQFARLSTQNRHTAVLDERNRMARDMHDTLAQGFTGVIVQLEAAEDATSRGFPDQAAKHLVRARDLARDSLKEARRSVQALRPQALDDIGLGHALESLFTKMTQGTELTPSFEVLGQPRPLPLDWEESLFRIGQEVLTNTIRHAHASRLIARLTFASDEVRLDMLDDGCGFDPSRVGKGYGLLGIRERVQAMGGQLAVRSADGTGASIVVILPAVDLAGSRRYD
jgi:PAS domain S-box-containing protein